MSQQTSPIVRAVFADLLVALSAVTLSATPGSAATTETCIAAPNSTAPDGSHWYFRTDRATQRKCWYLAAQGQKVHRAARAEPADEEPAARPARSKRESVASPAAANQASASEASATPTLPSDAQGRMQRFIYGAAPQVTVAEAAPQAAAETASVPPAGTLQWPAPAQSAVSSQVADASGGAPVTTAADPSDAQEAARDAAPAQPNATSGIASTAGTDAASVTPLQMLLLFVAALAIAGILLHTILKLALARRHRVYVDRREGTWSTDRDHERALLPHDFDAPMRAPSEAFAAGARDPDAERLTQLLRDIERRAAA